MSQKPTDRTLDSLAGTLDSLAGTATELVDELKDKGYSPAEAMVILCGAIVSLSHWMKHPELIEHSVDRLTLLAVNNLPTVQ